MQFTLPKGHRMHGAVKEGVLRNHMILPDDRIRHSVFYSILDTEWMEVESRLDTMMEG